MPIDPIEEGSSLKKRKQDVYSTYLEYLDSLDASSSVKKIKKESSAAESIEESKYAQPVIQIAMGTPLLSPSQDTVSFIEGIMNKRGELLTAPVVASMIEIGLQENTKKSLEGWIENLREIAEQVQQLVNSPTYQQQLFQQQALQDGKIQGVEKAEGSSSSGTSAHAQLMLTLDRLKTLDRVTKTDALETDTATSNSLQATSTLLATLVLGGAAFAGPTLTHATSAVEGIASLAQQTAPAFATSVSSLSNLIPTINLMVVAPLYFYSWDEAVSRFKNHERHQHVATIQKFAEDIIEKVSHPHYVLHILQQLNPALRQLPLQEQQKLSQMFKFILAGMALSLLYSAEVGKVNANQFGGIEPEEFKELLLGNFSDKTSSTPSKQEQLKNTLIKLARAQLQGIESKEERALAVDILLEYISRSQDLNEMLEPGKVFSDVLSSTTFTTEGQQGRIWV